MAKAEKVAAVKEITALFQDSNAAVLTEYRGLTVSQLTELRRSLGPDTTYAVLKNTLASIAAKEAGVTAFEGQLSGPSAIAFIAGDPVEAAKGLRDFARTNPQLIVKSGVLEGRAISAADVTALADLESREVLLAKVAGVLKASQAKAAALFQAPLSKTVRTVEALREKQAAGAPADAAPAEAPAAEAVDA
ncbi:50S ribosomal protein L10 [Kineococcus indalonis]|uniref:50S ribosomal protein L10 n=1 Tax=Kineococcus indalonis TaxID=2696566 RepID=UPI001412C902|nr:50S ribosomal protein L10 [Kineococcus indalonis]NAZ84916.1 50S ribosomal protein L10 [Kineococcus indalonis]